MTYASCLVTITAGALYAAFALAGGPASAQTKASCKQDYAAKKAAGETDGQSEAIFVKACRSLPKSGSAAAAPAAARRRKPTPAIPRRTWPRNWPIRSRI